MLNNYYQLFKLFDEIIPILTFSFLLAVILVFFHVKSPIKIASTFLLLLMCSIYGLVIGMIIGHSDSSEVGSIITATVTLMTSYLTYLASQKITGEIRSLIPSAVIALMLTLMVSMFYKIDINNSETEFSDAVNQILKLKN